MHRDTRLNSRRGAGHGERFWLSVAVVFVSLLWITQDLALWATVICVAGAVGGALAALHFGRHYLRSRRDGPR
ncbi:hypothetical protein [Streptomyces nanshensis]|uniref:DUF2530 domain-containing protein n=1 Tax=Streptomyces nanshensis TaxID=518642 RepID=A0A1E7KGG3_9ACTN|nr:hypothetical protein [Streptomyces nanshensis]OEV02963.1 hypothetical protein AN218_33065 [Streptomyces nanshensis]